MVFLQDGLNVTLNNQLLSIDIFRWRHQFRRGI